MDVYCFEDAGGWAVSADGRLKRFASRAEAFAEAKHLLRLHSPGRLVRSPPPTLPVAGPGTPAAEGDGLSPVAPRPEGASVAGPTSPEAAPEVTPVDWERLRGPAALGRSVLVLAGDPPPDPWATCRRIRVAGDTDLVDEVRTVFLAREPVVYELDPEHEPVSGSVPAEVWQVPVDFELDEEATFRLLAANAVDARDATRPRWPPAELAIEAGARSSNGGAAGDVVLRDGRSVLCDGGPLRFWDESTLGVPVLSRVALERGQLDPPDDGPPAADLASDQLESVGEPGACARIIAPAGSGKTRVLTERARYLLTRKRLPAAALTLVAFNKRAQEEMKDRTRDLPSLQVQTLNALALALLNGTGPFRDRGARVTTIDEMEVRRLLGELVTFPRRANTDPAAAWIDALSGVRLGLRDPARVEQEFGGDVDGFADLFPRYRRTMRTRGVVDFDEQIYLAIEALLTEADTRQHAQRVCRVLLVDEFQDLTPAHLLLIRLLSGPELDVFGVGDDDQTIYGYSGASPDWLIDYDRYFPGATAHALEINYRCPVPVVSAAVNLLSYNQRRLSKAIAPGPANHRDADSFAVVEADSPLLATTDRAAALVADGVDPRDIAVLARVNTLLAPVQVALHLRGIPTHNAEGARFLERTGVAAALSWLRLAVTTGRLASADIQRAARRPGRSLSPKLIDWMSEQDDLRGLERLAGRLNNDRDTDKVLGFTADLKQIRQRAETLPTAALLKFVRADIGLDQAMQTLDAARRGRNTAAHSDDLRALIALGTLHPEPATFGPWLAGALAHGRNEQGVALSTVHKVKGLEWRHVIVHDTTQGVFPHRLSLDVEEERRVFHVAITRGQESVTVVADAVEPSMFLTELAAPAPERTVPDEDAARPSTPGAPRAVSRTVDVPASVGLELAWGGYRGEITLVTSDHAVLTVGRARFVLPFGSQIVVGGASRTLGPPAASRRGKGTGRPAGSELASSRPVLLDALKAWRLERAKADGVPAYVVATDKSLHEIAEVLPVTPSDLLAVNGIGPAKLERYGDEILALIDEHRPPG